MKTIRTTYLCTSKKTGSISRKIGSITEKTGNTTYLSLGKDLLECVYHEKIVHTTYYILVS